MAHLKRYQMPKWPLPTKGKVYVTRPSPGPHPLQRSIPLLVLVRDYFKAAETGDEARTILNAGSIIVDGNIRKGGHFPVGMMDTINVPVANEAYRVTLQHDRLALTKISAAEATHKLCRVEGKSVVRGGQLQLNLHDARNILTSDAVQVGDTLDIDVPAQTIRARYPRVEGAECLIIAGKNQGAVGIIQKITRRTDLLGTSVAEVKISSGTVETRLENIFVTGGKAEKATSKAKSTAPKPEKKAKKAKKSRSSQE